MTVRTFVMIGGLVLSGCFLMAFTSGSKVFTKRDKTPMRKSPSLSGASVGQLPWGQQVTVKEAKGRWVKVNGQGKTGWVFMGNLTRKKPPSENQNDFLPTSAGETTASIAARPLEQSSVQYGRRRNLGSAVSDLQWLERTSDAISPAQVHAYMKKNKLGEYAQ